jgi:hypothetical protein
MDDGALAQCVRHTVAEAPFRVEKKRVIVNAPRLTATRSKAFFAFWSMHVEAHQLSGLNATQYAEAHRLPVIKFRRLRRRFELAPLAQDWHDLFHPVTPSPRRLHATLRDKLRDTLCISPLSGHTPTAATPVLSSGAKSPTNRSLPSSPRLPNLGCPH